MNPHAQQALIRAAGESAHPTMDLRELCDHAVAWYYGLAHSGSPSAREHWHAIPESRRHPAGGVGAPAGALGFFVSPLDVGLGHVVLCAGDGTAWTTDMVRTGKVDRRPIPAISGWVGLPFVGWSDPVFPGAGVDYGTLLEAPSPHQAHLTHLANAHRAHLRHVVNRPAGYAPWYVAAARKALGLA